ncbi:MAG: FAD-dependent oxidoreductase [Pseudomonadota bacterium]|nr:FAD-dependent oxidoreductase [Pseudomonadota bacterium]
MSRPDLCVIGAGSAGLAVAASAAQLGARVVLIERARMGGECLYTGCVPSKALLACARAAQSARQAVCYGVDAEPRVDFARVRRHVQSAIAAIAPHDSRERFEKLGVEVIEADARFVDARTVQAGEKTIRSRRFVIATGSDPALPKIEGIEGVRHFTNENIFDNETLPEHLVVVGGGPLGMELAQAHRRLGSRVTVLELGKAMPEDDPELARPLLQALAAEGVAIREDAKLIRVETESEGVALTVEEAGQHSRVLASHLLIAVGRAPRVKNLGLEQAGVKYQDKGIVVDARLRTTARGIFAAGDVVDGPRFTHVCSYHAGIVVRNALFHLPAKLNYAALPWVTYTDPELAQVGMTEEQAKKKFGEKVQVLRVAYADNDRAQAEGKTEGVLKLVATGKGQVLGASIRGVHAGELAALWVLAIEQGLKLKQIAQTLVPYPGWAELNKAAAVEFLKPKLRNPALHRLVRILSWLP